MGKEQAEQKDGQTHAQVVQGAQIARRAEEAAHRVSGSPEVQRDDVRQVKDEPRRRRGESGGKGEAEEQQEDEGPQQESFREDYLGKKIDITG
jgi:hypothetical protein